MRFVLPITASTQSAEKFYKEKAANLYIGFSHGGSCDFYGQLVSRPHRQAYPRSPDTGGPKHAEKLQTLIENMAKVSPAVSKRMQGYLKTGK